MAGELAYDPVTGQLVYSPATGQLALNCEVPVVYYKLTPCLKISGNNCTYCTGSTPYKVTIIVSGITVNDGCCDNGDNSSQKISSYSDPNGTFVLTQNGGDNCQWDYTDTDKDAVRNIFFYNGSCSGSPDYQENYTEYRYILTRTTAFEWRLYIRPFDPITPEQLELFYGESSVDYDCTNTSSISNNQTSSDPCDEDGYGGTVQIIPGDNDTCPGGAAIYTDTDLSAHVGKIIKVTADGVCYAVTQDGDHSDGAIGAHTEYDDCDTCCDA